MLELQDEIGVVMETIARKLIEKTYGAKNLIYETYCILNGNKAVVFVDSDTEEIYVMRRCSWRRQYVLYKLHIDELKYYSFKAVEEENG